jgi:hypothetical protein
MSAIAFGAFCFLLIVTALATIRSGLLARRTRGETGTWDCGYAQPAARMQYTASSFAQPLTGQFRHFLWTRRSVELPKGIFPRAANLSTHTPDVCMDGFYLPIFAGMRWVFSKLRWLQQGRVQIYVLYLCLTLLALLIWKLG